MHACIGEWGGSGVRSWGRNTKWGEIAHLRGAGERKHQCARGRWEYDDDSKRGFREMKDDDRVAGGFWDERDAMRKSEDIGFACMYYGVFARQI